jgi:uncharacterized repeat protein (TIGR02543 family)
MNKKFFLTIFAFLSVFLSSCGPNTSAPKYNVYFFTANTNATRISTLFDQTPGEFIVAPDIPVRPGFEFAGWYTDITRTTPWDFETDLMPEASLVLYARWVVEIKTITYVLNGGEMTTENYATEFLPGSTTNLPSARRTGHIFKGWFDYDQDFERFPASGGTRPGDRPIVSLSTTVTSDVTLYAHWEVIEVVVSFRANHPGGTTVVANPSSRRISFGTVVAYGSTFPADFGTVAGFTFIGWNTRADGSGDWLVNGSVFTRTAPTTLHAQWQPVA